MRLVCTYMNLFTNTQ